MKKPVDAYTKPSSPTVPNTKGVGAQVLAPTVLPDGTKEFDLTAEVTDWEVAPGKTRAGVDLQRHGPGTDDQGGARATRCASCSTTSCRSRRRSTSTASTCPNAMDGVPDVTQPR